MKKIFSPALVSLLITVAVPGLLFSQQRQQTQAPVGSTSGARPSAGVTVPGKRGARPNAGNVIPLIERDVDEALGLIHDN